MVTNVTGIATDFITFSRASLATVTNNVGLIAWAPHNLLLASEQFDASNWTKITATVTANATVAPNGTNTADIMFEAVGTSEHNVRQSLLSFNGTVPTTFGAFVRANGRSKGFMRFYNTTSPFDGAQVDFDLSAVTATSTGINGGTALAQNIQSVGGGWFFVAITGYGITASATYGAQIGARDDSGNLSYAGDVTKGLYLWGASLYRSDLAGMQPNASTNPAFSYYNSTTPKNLLGYTEDWSNAAWTKVSTSVVSNSAYAPNGLFTADAIVESTATNNHSVYQVPTSFTLSKFLVSCYVKTAYGSRFIQVFALQNGGAHGVGVTLDSAGGFVNIVTLGSNLSISSYDIISVGDGWVRVALIVSASSAASVGIGLALCSTPVWASSYPGDGSSSAYFWGAQVSDSASIDAYSPVYGAAPSASAYYGPRRDFSPTTLACNGLLVEEQRTNLALNSAAFDNASWLKTSVVVTANDAIAPDGTLTADLVTLTGAPGANQRLYNFDTQTGTYTVSFYLKAKDAGDVGTTIFLDTTGGGANGAVITLTASWVRYTLTFSPTGYFQYRLISNTGYTATKFLIWGAQLEAGSFATSYIPTAASTVTRSADVASVGVSQFPYSASEGTLVVSLQRPSISVAGYAVALQQDASTNLIALIADTSVKVNVRDATVGVTFDQSKPLVAAPMKVGIAAKANNANAAWDGVLGTDDTTVTMPSGAANVLRIGNISGNASFFNGHIRQITYLPRRISNTDLQTRTT